MDRKLKRPDGFIVEEYVTASAHFVENGQIAGHDHDWTDGMYTGRICFRFADGKVTRWYTRETAPKWLRALFFEAIGE